MPKVRRATPLSDDLLVEVLSHLPVDAATRFKSVSSSWRRLISGPYFRSLQSCRSAHRSAGRLLGFFHSSVLNFGGSIYFKPLSAAAGNPSLSGSINRQLQVFNGQRNEFGSMSNPLQASSNGLLLVGRRSYYVWNPANNYRIPISPPSSELSRDRLYGLSASPSLKSFEIVSIADESSPSPAFVYSSDTKSWMSLDTPTPVTASRTLNLAGPASIRRSLHWLKERSILVLDTVQRTTREMELPGGHKQMIRRVNGPYSNAWLGAVGGHMYLVVATEVSMEVWCLENYDEVEWRKVTVVEGCGVGAPLFFDGQRIAFAAVGEYWRGERSTVKFYNTCSKEWQESYVLDDFLDRSRVFLPYIV